MTTAVELGSVGATPGIANFLKEKDLSTRDLIPLLQRHIQGDWGTVDEEDKAANDEALKHGGRLLSAYEIAETKIWIITEADRRYTTVLLPEEY